MRTIGDVVAQHNASAWKALPKRYNCASVTSWERRPALASSRCASRSAQTEAPFQRRGSLQDASYAREIRPNFDAGWPHNAIAFLYEWSVSDDPACRPMKRAVHFVLPAPNLWSMTRDNGAEVDMDYLSSKGL